jgi:hypothetical protein
MDLLYYNILERLGNYFKNHKWFRKSYLGFEWFIMKNPKSTTKSYLAWEDFNWEK